MSDSSGIFSFRSKNDSEKLSVRDSSKVRTLSRQTLTFSQVIMVLLKLKDILALIFQLDLQILYIYIYIYIYIYKYI